MNILCMTPIEHLDGAVDLINKCGEVTYKPNIKVSELKNVLIENEITQSYHYHSHEIFTSLFLCKSNNNCTN